MEQATHTGHLAIIGLGPGSRDLVAPRAIQMLEVCDTVIGYRVYVEQIRDLLAGKDVHVSELTHEVERATLAVQQARSGRRVCIVSSGDAGIYGMAGLVLDLLSSDGRDDEFSRPRSARCCHPEPFASLEGKLREGSVSMGTEMLRGVYTERSECAQHDRNGLERKNSLSHRYEPLVEVIPGISALNAAAALLGAPLMHDFAVISLSDLLTPWDTIARRLSAAAAADFVMVLYNPISRKRQWQLGEARHLLLASRSATTPVGVVRNAYRPEQQVWLTTLEHLLDYEIDMFTTIVIGNSCTRVQQGRMITPRGYENIRDPYQ